MLLLLLSLAIMLLILISGFFSGSETGVISCSSLKAQNLANEGDKHGITLHHLLSDRHRIIILILILNNIVNTTYTIAGEVWLADLANFFLGTNQHASLGVLVSTLILTPPLVIFGEIFPKSLFRHYSFSLTKVVSPILNRIMVMCTPLLAPLSIFTSIRSSKQIERLKLSREHLHLLIESSTESGKIMGLQENIIKHVLNLSNITLEDLHQPTENILFLNSNLRAKQALQTIREKKMEPPYFVQRKGKTLGYTNLKNLYSIKENEKIGNHLRALPKLSSGETGLKGLNHLLMTKTDYALVIKEKKMAGYVSLKEFIAPAI